MKAITSSDWVVHPAHNLSPTGDPSVGISFHRTADSFWSYSKWLTTFVFRLKASHLKVRFCTNESQHIRSHLVQRLQGLGFDVEAHEVFSPAPAACQLVKDRGLVPHLLVDDSKLIHKSKHTVLLFWMMVIQNRHYYFLVYFLWKLMEKWPNCYTNLWVKVKIVSTYIFVHRRLGQS